jgi:glutaryl-CoA dehydrogenase
MSAFNWADPFLLEEQLTEEERLSREKLLPNIQDAYFHQRTEPGIFAEMGELGLLGTTVPPEFGGAGASYVGYG